MFVNSPYRCIVNKFYCTLAIVILWGSFGKADTLSYLRFEEGSGYGAYDETGLMDGGVLGFTSVDPGGGDTGGTGWSTNVPSTAVPQTGEANTGSLHFGPGMVDLSNANVLSLGLEFTVEMFLMLDAPNTFNSIFGFSPVSQLYFTLIDSSGNLYFRMQFQDQIDSLISASMLQEDVWAHVALVVDSANYAIYVDGQNQYAGSIPSGGEGPYWFSGDPTTGNRTLGDGFSGWIDEFRISDEALSPSQFLNASIPEPGTLGLLGLGFIGLIIRKRLR